VHSVGLPNSDLVMIFFRTAPELRLADGQRPICGVSIWLSASSSPTTHTKSFNELGCGHRCGSLFGPHSAPEFESTKAL